MDSATVRESSEKRELAQRSELALTSGPAANESDELLSTMEPGGAALRLPLQLDVMIPVSRFQVRNLAQLRPGELVESRWNAGEDLPLSTGGAILAWTEFEVVANKLAVRITRLA